MSYADVFPGDIFAENLNWIKEALREVDLAESTKLMSTVRAAHLSAQLVKILGRNEAVEFVATLLESKYTPNHNKWCSRKARACPKHADIVLLPEIFTGAIENDVTRRAFIYAEMVKLSGQPLTNLLMTSTDYLSHVLQSQGNTISHGDEYGLHVCGFLQHCLLPILRAMPAN